ncbi:glycosyltransferase family 9 protein [Bradyrhizobium sp. USDA 3650]
MSDNTINAPTGPEQSPPSELRSKQSDKVFLHLDPVLPAAPGNHVTVQGVAAAHEHVKAVVIQCGSNTQLARHGLFRPELAKAYPKHIAFAYSGFSTVLQIPESCQPGETLNVSVTVKSRGGYERSLEIPIDIVEAHSASKAGSTSDHPSNAGAAMQLNVESAAIDRAGLLRLGGWAICHSRIESVVVSINDELIGNAQIGIERQDVASAWPDFPNSLTSGFFLATDATNFEHPIYIRVTANAMGGIVREVSVPVDRISFAKPREVSETHKLTTDEAVLTTEGLIKLRGWAVSSAGVAEIRVLLEDELIGVAEYGSERPDVGNLFPALPGSRQSGFAFSGAIQKEALRDEHIFTLDVVLKDGGTQTFKIALAPQRIEIVEQNNPAVDSVLIFVDDPTVKDSVAAQPITGGLSIVGWALARDGISSIKVELDKVNVGNAYYGMRREDIETAFPDWGGSLLSGFAFSLPRRALTEGQHLVSLTAITEAALEKTIEFTIEVTKSQEQAGPWSLRKHIPVLERLLTEAVSQRLPNISFLITLNCENANAEFVKSSLSALNEQTYTNWQLLLIGSPSALKIVNKIAASFAVIAPRLLPHSKKLSLPAGSLTLPLDAGDVLSCDALFEFARASALKPGSDFFYGDERKNNAASQTVDAFFKPSWSPDLLLSSNYVGRPWCARADVISAANLEPSKLEHSGRYDAVCRLTELAKNIQHIPKVLCSRSPTGIESRKDELKALRQALRRRNINATVEKGRVEHSYRIRHKREMNELVSIIIPTCAARGLVKTCIDSLRQRSTYKQIEIIGIDNILDEDNEWKGWLRDNCDVVVEILEPFNWSRFNNLGAAEASGSYLLFLNDDIEVIEPNWLETLLALAAEEGVGIVGPQLLYPDRKVQHAGLFLSGENAARHAFRFCDETDPGYFGLALTQRNVIGVTGACLLVKKSVFDELGGFDEAHAVVNNDLDFCLRSHAAGYRNIYTPFATLIHHELASRATMKDVHDRSAFAKKWARIFSEGDPFFHPDLSRNSDNYQHESEPTQVVFAGHPIYRKDQIKRILAVKLDHIGDFLTAFPAFQRLKQHFPNAELYALTAPAAKTLASLEPSIHEIIPFEFFHARSGLGQKEVSEADLDALRTKLSEYGFDIAIDLRKHPDTRKVLQYTGAPIKAGFEPSTQQFSWLDISVPWEGDHRFLPKRQHVADDLINLVDAVSAAGILERSVIKKPADWRQKQLRLVSELENSTLFERRVVCIHPAAGTEMRQWPPQHFAALTDMLVDAADINVVVIGGPDEAAISEDMIERVRHKDRVTSLVGRLKLPNLPLLIDCCTLFVGNNSGPKHLAAALGVPTVGIHSGVVDPREWGPLGTAALAIKREMTCAPCYSAKREDCHRGLVCLTELHPRSVLLSCLPFLQLKAGFIAPASKANTRSDVKNIKTRTSRRPK